MIEQSMSDFYRYPSIGTDDYRYQYQTALVRMFEMQLLSKATLQDMTNANDFRQALDLLAGTEYSLSPASKDLGDLNALLPARRTALREQFCELMIDKPIVSLLRTWDDFANLRLAVRRSLTGKAIGSDYSPDGNVSPKQFEQVFAEENYEVFPEYMQEAAERAFVAYYQNKDVRQIDHAIDAAQAEYNLAAARRLKNIFLVGLFRIQIDLTNIRTVLRLKFAGSQTVYFSEKIMLGGGFLELDRLKHAMDLNYEALGALFYVTPYYEVVDAGASYLASHKSFLKLEQRCDEHLLGFLKTTMQIVTGPQPIIAYLLTKENEIRTVRLILTAKKNHLDTKLILDRIS